MSSTKPSALVAIETEICGIAASMAHQEIRLLELVGEFDAANGWMATPSMSCAHWLATLLDIEVCTAREKVRVARALRRLPIVRESPGNGVLSYAKVRQVTRVATPENEEELVGLAALHPAGDLPRVLARWQRRKDPKAADERQHEERGVSFRDEPTGNRTATIQLSADLIAMLELLIDAEVGSASADASDPHASLRHQRAHVFARIIARLAAPDASADASAGLRAELILHRRVGETSLTDGTLLPPAVARYYTCETDVRVMTHYPDGSPADVGRRHRIVTPRLRLLVLERDGYQCQHPGCQARHYLEVHHIIHWEDRGTTEMVNLITYCGYHHRSVHRHDAMAG